MLKYIKYGEFMFLKLKTLWHSHQKHTLEDLYQMFLKEQDQTYKYEFIDILKILKNTDIENLKSYFNGDLGSLFFIYLVGGGHLRERADAWIYTQNETLKDLRYQSSNKLSPFFFESFNKKQVDIFTFLFNHVSEQLNTPYLNKLLETLDQDKKNTGLERQFGQYMVYIIQPLMNIEHSLLLKNLSFLGEENFFLNKNKCISFLQAVYKEYPVLFQNMDENEFNNRITIANTLGLSLRETMNVSSKSSLTISSLELD